MRIHRAASVAVSTALLLSAGCMAADSRREPTPAVPAHAAPQPTAPASTEFSVRDKEAKDKDKRGNTPVGTDRSGGGPASGAILDPDGAVTKNPVPRER